MATPNPNGNPNSFFQSWCRRELRDQPVRYGPEAPVADGVTGTTAANSKPFRAKRQPVIVGSMNLTAPGALYAAVYDTNGAAPTVAPALSDAGAGALAAGTYQVVYTYVYGTAGESGFSPLSNAQVIAINHNLTFGALSGIPAGVTAIRIYIVAPTGAAIGKFGADVAVVANATSAQTINANGNGTLPVLVIVDTGEVYFPVAPASGALSMSYQAVRFSDQQILDALTNGMQAMFPEVWQTATDTSLVTSPISYEYTLPAAFLNENVKLMRLEVQPPGFGAFNIWVERNDWEVISPTILKLLRLFTSSTRIRLSYNAPYNNLSDVDPDKMKLPVYYALGELYLVQETSRTRQDDLPAQTGSAVSQPQAASAVAELWFSRFEMEMRRLGRENPNRHSVRFGTTPAYGTAY